MTYKDFKENIQLLIRQDELKLAINEIIKVAADTIYENRVIILESRLSDLDKSSSVGTQDYKDIDTRKTQIRSALLETLGELKNVETLWQDKKTGAGSGDLPKIPVFFSYVNPYRDDQKQYMEALIKHLGEHGLVLESTMWSNKAPLMSARKKISMAYGCIVLAFERGFAQEIVLKGGTKDERRMLDVRLATSWMQMEPAMAYQIELPMLIFREKGILQEGTLDPITHEWNVYEFDPKDTVRISEIPMKSHIENWVQEVRALYSQKNNR